MHVAVRPETRDNVRILADLMTRNGFRFFNQYEVIDIAIRRQLAYARAHQDNAD